MRALKFRKTSRVCRVLMVDESVPCGGRRRAALVGGMVGTGLFSAYEAPAPNAHRLYVMTTNPGEQYRRGSDGLIFRGRPAPYSISRLRSPTGTRFDQSACASPVMCGQGAKVAPAPLYCPRRMEGSGIGKPGERRGNLGRLLAFVHRI